MSHPIVFPGARSPAQAKAGNYKKRRVQWQGLTISIENEAGTIRRGKSRDGHEWEQRMVFPYGEIMRTEGVDGDPVDVFLGPNMDAPMVYVVHQRTYGDWDKYDEDKCGVGFLSEDEAAAAFLANYNDPRFLGPITAMPVSTFVEKAKATKEAPAMIKAILFFKSRVDPYVRKGRIVLGYTNRKVVNNRKDPGPSQLTMVFPAAGDWQTVPPLTPPPDAVARVKVGYTWKDDKGRTWEVYERMPFGKFRVRTSDGSRVGEMYGKDIPAAAPTPS